MLSIGYGPLSALLSQDPQMSGEGLPALVSIKRHEKDYICYDNITCTTMWIRDIANVLEYS